MERVVLFLLMAAAGSSGQRPSEGVDNCPHADGATFDVDVSLGEWRLRDEIGSSTPSVSFKFSKTTPEAIAEYREQHANTTTLGAAEVDWSRVPLYCEVTYNDDKYKFVLELLNSDGLVRLVPIDKTLFVRMGSIRPIYFYIQNVRDTVLVHGCGTDLSYVMYKQLQHISDDCNDFAVNATFDPNTSLGEWVGAGDNSTFELIAKTSQEIAAYRLELRDTPFANMTINWNRVNFFAITDFSSDGRGIPITFLVELIDNKGAGRMIPVGISLRFALRSHSLILPHVQFKKVGNTLGLMICPTKLPRYFTRR